jgi:hypothetical protein
VWFDVAMPDVEVSRVIAATPEELYDIVGDLPRMTELSSDEHRGGQWIGGASGPVVGARFKGRNAHGKRSWQTVATIDIADRGRQLAFDVTGGPLKVARWSYRFEPVDGGTLVTETWTDRRNALTRAIGGFLSGVSDRAAANRQAMETTLANLADRIERAPDTHRP